MKNYRFNRMEFAGSFGDLGTLLPLSIGMILVNGLNPLGVFFSIGIFYIVSGIYYGIPVSVQPMKVIGAYAIATGAAGNQILASGALMGMLLLVIGITGIISAFGKYIPKSVIRGVQLSTGVLLMAQGVRLMMGTSTIQALRQAVEPYLVIQNIGPIPVGIIIGVIGFLITLFFLDNRRFPSGLLIVLGGMAIGLVWGTHEGLSKIGWGIHIPEFFPLGMPVKIDFTYALFALVLPQIPMTVGNAVIANADLSKEYFGEKAGKVTLRSLCISMGFANMMSFLFGGIPLCHGAGGLAAHYRFGARTAGSNLIIGIIFVALAVFMGGKALAVLYLVPMSALGILLVFAGAQLALTILDLKERKDMFVTLLILGITFASNLAAGFIAGILIAYILKSERLTV